MLVGVRLPDGEFPDNPGEYSKVVVNGADAWMVKVPTGGSTIVIGSVNLDGKPCHWVQEHKDGTITVRPNPIDAPPGRSNSNSILHNGWHGYIYEGVWTET